MKERDEPIRLGKGNDIVSKGVVHLKTELEKLSQDKENVRQVLAKEKKQLEHLDELVGEKREECKNKLKEIRDLDIQSSEEQQKIAQLKNEGRRLAEDNAEIAHEIEIQTLKRRQR